MKYLVLIAVSVFGGLLFYQFYVRPTKGDASTSDGAARMFVECARSGDYAKLEPFAEAASKERVLDSARKFHDLGMGQDWIPMWQRAQADHGADAWTCQVTGKSMMLVVEVNRGGGGFLIHEAQLASM